MFSGLEADVRYLSRRGIDLIERSIDERVDLDGVDEAVPERLHPRGGIGGVHPGGWIRQVGRWRAIGAKRLQLPGQSQDLRHFDNLDRGWRIDGLHGGGRIIEMDGGRLLHCRAAAEGRCAEQQRQRRFAHGRDGGDEESREERARSFAQGGGHCPSSFDQLMALT